MPGHLPINHLLTPHSSPLSVSKVSDPIRISLLFPLTPPFLLPRFLPFFFPVSHHTCLFFFPFLSTSLSCLCPYLCSTLLAIHFSITFCLSAAPFPLVFISQLSPSCFPLQSCTLTRCLWCDSLSFSHFTSYVLVLPLFPVECVEEQSRPSGW